MPITSSAKKALRGSRRKQAMNLLQKKVIADVIKQFRKLLSENKKKDAQALFPKLQKALDKAVKTGIMKAGAAARKKSRFVKMIKKLA
jgi:small subunit ribosomal protein S20